eukprot:COSAG02_NODE_712_length_18122_cov_6.792321_8_plen_50_part_00
MAGEIEKPEVVFPKAIAILIPTLATVRSIDSAHAYILSIRLVVSSSGIL